MPVKPTIDPLPKPGQPFGVNLANPDGDATVEVRVFIGNEERKFELDGVGPKTPHKVDVASGSPKRFVVSGYGAAASGISVTVKLVPEASDTQTFI